MKSIIIMIGMMMEYGDDHHTDYHCNPDACDDENDQIADEERTLATSAPLHRPTKHGHHWHCGRNQSHHLDPLDH